MWSQQFPFPKDLSYFCKRSIKSVSYTHLDVYKRQHHTSSIKREIWMYDCRTEKHTNLTRHAGEDRNPVRSPGGQTLYFLSERNGGSFKVYSLQPAHPEAVKAVSSFKTHPVRFLSISGNGTLCYGYDGEIYTCLLYTSPRISLPCLWRMPHWQLLYAGQRASASNEYLLPPPDAT